MTAWKHNRSKPVIGVTGGVGSGKSTIGRLLASQGCAVLDSDVLAHEALESAEVREAVRRWLGEAVIRTDGTVDRKAVGSMVFGDPGKLQRLNELIHPRVARARAARMAGYLADPAVRAVVWDSPLLVETGLNTDCDAVIFVKVPRDIRLQRIVATRGWTEEEFARREKSQIPLDKKAELADYYIDNSGDEVSSLHQVQRVLSHLLTARR